MSDILTAFIGMAKVMGDRVEEKQEKLKDKTQMSEEEIKELREEFAPLMGKIVGSCDCHIDKPIDGLFTWFISKFSEVEAKAKREERENLINQLYDVYYKVEGDDSRCVINELIKSLSPKDESEKVKEITNQVIKETHDQYKKTFKALEKE